MKKIVAFVIIGTFILTPLSFAAQNQPLKNLGDGMKELVVGSVETPDNIKTTNTKGTAVVNCTDKTKDDVGRGIVKIFKGAYQIATFWYPREEQQTTVKK